MKTLRFIALLVAIATVGLSAAGSLIQRAATRASAKRNPFAGSESAWLAGTKLYARECASCHGTNREGGGSAPPLKQPDVYEASDGALFWILRNGSLYRGMPSFAHLPEAQRWQIITFLKSRQSHSFR